MTIKELIVELSKFDDKFLVYYVNEESSGPDEVAEIEEYIEADMTTIIVLGREGCFG